MALKRYSYKPQCADEKNTQEKRSCFDYFNVYEFFFSIT